jgi:hypothetical protein
MTSSAPQYDGSLIGSDQVEETSDVPFTLSSRVQAFSLCSDLVFSVLLVRMVTFLFARCYLFSFFYVSGASVLHVVAVTSLESSPVALCARASRSLHQTLPPLCATVLLITFLLGTHSSLILINVLPAPKLIPLTPSPIHSSRVSTTPEFTHYIISRNLCHAFFTRVLRHL